MEGKEHDGVIGGRFFSPNGKRVAYVARRGQKELVVVDGVEQNEYDYIAWGGLVLFSPDSKHIAYIGARAGKYMAVINGVEGKEYDQIGGKLPAVTRRARYTALHTGKLPSRESDLQSIALRKIIAFSPNSNRIAYVGERNGKQFLVMNDGIEGREYDGIRTLTLSFSPKSRFMAYVASRDQKWVVVVDGVEAKEYDNFPNYSQLMFDGPKSFHFVGERDGDFLRAEIEIVRE